MILGIRGVGFVNKGAELMLHAILQEVRTWREVTQVVLWPASGRGHLARATALGLSNAAVLPFRGKTLYAPAFLPTPRRLAGQAFCSIDRVDAILDASGFEYSDQWGPGPARELQRLMERWERPGKNYIFLPQAFGPFAGGELRRLFTPSVRKSPLVFARDEASYGHMLSLPLSQTGNLRRAPDFTLSVKPAPIDDPATAGRVCLIPNYRMIDKTNSPEAYVAFLRFVVDFLTREGVGFFFLIHEDNRDREIVRVLEKAIGRPLPIVTEGSPLRLKGILRRALFVIGSRFHGLVSALTQGVPVVAAGWSHKYQMLLQEHGCAGLVLKDLADQSHTESVLRRMLSAQDRQQIARAIQETTRRNEHAVCEMWTQVRSALT